MAIALWTESRITPMTKVTRIEEEPTISVPSAQNPTTPDVKPIATYEEARAEIPQGLVIKKREQPVTSVLHPDTPEQLPLNTNVGFSIRSTNNALAEYKELFPQHGKTDPGHHYRIENARLLTQRNREDDSVLIICVFNGAESWGEKRSVMDFFELIETFNYPKEKISIALLTSSIQEFTKVKRVFESYIHQYPRLSVIFRNDFVQGRITRDNRHEAPLQGGRRRMIARYRNYALLSTLETWHQHVLWLDADIKKIPGHLLPKMVKSGLDILPDTYLLQYVRR